jgi:hypothetical protein
VSDHHASGNCGRRRRQHQREMARIAQGDCAQRGNGSRSSRAINSHGDRSVRRRQNYGVLVRGGVERDRSSSRPTRAVRPLACSASKRLSTDLARRTAQARTFPAMPLRSFDPTSANSKRLPRSRPAAMTTVFGAAIPCRRAARLGVSPATPRSWASQSRRDRRRPTNPSRPRCAPGAALGLATRRPLR